jgi:hypothetical protein
MIRMVQSTACLNMFIPSNSAIATTTLCRTHVPPPQRSPMFCHLHHRTACFITARSIIHRSFFFTLNLQFRTPAISASWAGWTKRTMQFAEQNVLARTMTLNGTSTIHVCGLLYHRQPPLENGTVPSNMTWNQARMLVIGTVRIVQSHMQLLSSRYSQYWDAPISVSHRESSLRIKLGEITSARKRAGQVDWEYNLASEFLCNREQSLPARLFEGAEQFLEAVQAVLESIERVTSYMVFLEWIDRLRKCIAPNGERTD